MRESGIGTRDSVVGLLLPYYTGRLRFPAGSLLPVRRAARWLFSLGRVSRGALPAVDDFPVR